MNSRCRIIRDKAGPRIAASSACGSIVLPEVRDALTIILAIGSGGTLQERSQLSDPTDPIMRHEVAVSPVASVAPLEVDFTTEIDAARREIKDLLDAMAAGKQIACSEELMALCEQVVRQTGTSVEETDVENWAKELADDLSKFTDEGLR